MSISKDYSKIKGIKYHRIRKILLFILIKYRQPSFYRKESSWAIM